MTTVDPNTQPDPMATLQSDLNQFASEPGALMPILHAIQDEVGYIPQDLVPAIARALNLSRAEVHGVVTYYHDFRTQPPARHVLRICRAEACQAMGADQLLAHAQQRLGCRVHATSNDGTFTLESAYCLGMCATSPAMMLDGKPYARVTPQSFDSLVALTRSQT